MNEYDSNRILDLTKKINYTLTKKIEDADCYVLSWNIINFFLSNLKYDYYRIHSFDIPLFW